MARAWLFQDHRQRQKLGDKAPWSVGWIDPEGKRKSKSIGSHSAAEKFSRKLEGQLAAGTYQNTATAAWADFRERYERQVLKNKAAATQETTKIVLDHFERICKPKRVSAIRTATIDDYIEQRIEEPGAKKGSTVSPATVNRELRHLKAVLKKAVKWKYLNEMPDVEMLREMDGLKRFVTAEHFAAIYQHCEAATKPECGNCSTADWWRALIVTAYMTGWRIREILHLRRDNLDMENGIAILAADETKGKREERIPLHPVVVEHLNRIAGFDLLVFPVHQDRRVLWVEFARIQEAAGIHLPCSGDHEHTPACHVYGFHGLRYSFANMNHDRLSGDALQALMRHKSYATTKRYINMANRLSAVVADLHVPEVLRTVAAG